MEESTCKGADYPAAAVCLFLWIDVNMACSFDNAEVYAGGKAEEVMGQAIKVSYK